MSQDSFDFKHPLNAPHDTFDQVKLAANAPQAVRLLEESMNNYEKAYAARGYDTHTLDGGKEVWEYTHTYLPQLAKLLQTKGHVARDPNGRLVETGVLPDMAMPWLKQHHNIDTGHDGYVNIDELQAARRGNRNKVHQAFLDYAINNYDRLAEGDRGIRISNMPRPRVRPEDSPNEREQQLAQRLAEEHRLAERRLTEQRLAEQKLSALQGDIKRTQQVEAVLQERHRVEVLPGDSFRSIALRISGGNKHDAYYEEQKLRRLNPMSDAALAKYPGMKLRTRSDWEIGEEARRLARLI